MFRKHNVIYFTLYNTCWTLHSELSHLNMSSEIPLLLLGNSFDWKEILSNWKLKVDRVLFGGRRHDDKLELIFYGIYIKFLLWLRRRSLWKFPGGAKKVVWRHLPFTSPVERSGLQSQGFKTIKGKRKSFLFLCSQSPSFHQQFIKFSSQTVHLSRLPSGCGLNRS